MLERSSNYFGINIDEMASEAVGLVVGHQPGAPGAAKTISIAPRLQLRDSVQPYKEKEPNTC